MMFFHFFPTDDRRQDPPVSTDMTPIFTDFDFMYDFFFPANDSSVRAWSVLELDVRMNMSLFTKNSEKRPENTVKK